MQRERLILFARYPVAGQAKTRLIPALGPDGAAAFHGVLTTHAMQTLRRFRAKRRVAVEVRYTGADQDAMAGWLGPDVVYRPQPDGDLGERMSQTFRDAFLEGSRRAVIMGSDCPGITENTLNEAFDSLSGHDVVLGPAEDGGYYMIGQRAPGGALFDGVDWGTETVYNATVELAEALGLDWCALPPLPDVDRPEDLADARARVAHEDLQDPDPAVSVIIPTLNEAENLPAALAHAVPAGCPVECIVVDAGSADGTPALARTYGAKVLLSVPGRATQMNAGAALAQAPYLLFLHADTLLPPDYGRLIEQAMEDPEVVGGAFTLRIDEPGWAYRCLETFTGFRVRWLKRPYGDQALFMRREAYEALEGFPDLPIMEDYVLIRRLRKLGGIHVLRDPVRTSGRRWRKLGVWRLTLLHQAIILGYWFGVSPARLARWRHGPPMA